MKGIDITNTSRKVSEKIKKKKDEKYKEEDTITRPNVWRIFAFSGRKEYNDDD